MMQYEVDMVNVGKKLGGKQVISKKVRSDELTRDATESV